MDSGWTIFNNKGKPVRQYEPFFSTLPEQQHHFEFGRQEGVSPILFYDPVERVVATVHPNHTWEKVVFDPWQQKSYDVNDTVAGDPRTDPDISGYVSAYFRHIAPNPQDWQTWLQQLGVDPLNPPPDSPGLAPEKKAAVRTLPHAETPTTVYFDTLGHPFLSVAHNGKDPGGAPILYYTRTLLDIEGNQRQVTDAKDRIVMRYNYDLLGNRIHQASMEAGERWLLNDAGGQPIRAWDSRGHMFRTAYDELRRLLKSFVTGADVLDPGREVLFQRILYGEQHPDHEKCNLRGRAYLHLDQAGAITNEFYDFKGNQRQGKRRLAKNYQSVVAWGEVDALMPSDHTSKVDLAGLAGALVPLLEAETFHSSTTYDALNRPIQMVAPHSDRQGATIPLSVHVLRPGYNEANLLERLNVWLEQTSAPSGLLDPAVTPPSGHGVKNIDYNAKGQRLKIDYRNDTATFYTYDSQTFRLVSLKTARPAGANGLAPQLFINPAIVQSRTSTTPTTPPGTSPASWMGPSPTLFITASTSSRRPTIATMPSIDCCPPRAGSTSAKPPLTSSRRTARTGTILF